MTRVMLLLVAAMTGATAAAGPDVRGVHPVSPQKPYVRVGPVPEPTPPPGVTAAIEVPSEVLLAQPDPPPGIEEMLKRDEGRRLRLYRDSRRNWTIGYGRNITARGITEAEALFLLQNDIRACQVELDVHLKWWRLLSPPRQMVMLSLCYNLGIYGLKEFKGALSAMETGRYPEAARLFLHSRWAKQVGHRAKRIAELIDPGRAAPAPSNGRFVAPSAGRRAWSEKRAQPVRRHGRRLH